MKICKQCGTQLEDNAMFCANCGTTADMSETTEQAPFGNYSMDAYAGGGFIENFRNKIGNNILFMIAIILSSAGVFLQLINNMRWLSDSAGSIFQLLGTLFGAGVAIAALWFIFIASKKPGFPIGYNITFLVLKIFFIASLAWKGIWFISGMVDVVELLSHHYTSNLGAQILCEDLIQYGTTIAYLVFALLFMIKTENNVKTNSGDWAGQKKFAIMCFVYAGGLILSSLIYLSRYVDAIYTLSTWSIAAASVLYGILVMKNSLAEDAYRPY